MEPMLFTARLHLRPLQFSDASAMTALANDFDIARMTVRLPFPYRRGDSDWWIARHRSFGELAFAILANGQLVGCCGIDEPAIAAPEIGYWIGKPYWRRGFATEAVRALVAFAFEDARCNEVVVSHFVDNTGSRSVILRAGFVPVGTSERFSLARAADVLCVDYALRRAQAQVLGLARDRPPWLSRPATEGMCRGLMFRRPRPTLRTARLCLRPLAASDADSVMAMAGDPRVARMLSDMPHPATRPEILRWLAHRPGEVRFAIELDGRMIGSIGYFHERLGCAELGYWLGADWWGQGYTREAAAAVTSHGFTCDGLRRFTSAHFLDNPASAKVLGQLGFRPGRRRRAWCPARGANVAAQTASLDAADAGYPMVVPRYRGLPRTLLRALGLSAQPAI